MEKLFEDIQNQLNIESKKYKKLKICKYTFEISKVGILSIATGLSFIHQYICYIYQCYFNTNY